MQATSNVPLWRLYHNQEPCPDSSTSLEVERDMLVCAKSVVFMALWSLAGAYSVHAFSTACSTAKFKAIVCGLQDKLDLSDEQRCALAACYRRFRSALGTLAKERASINAALAKAAALGQSGMKKVMCSASVGSHSNT